VIVYTAAFHATAEDSFIWSGTIGTLILLVAYILASLGCIMLVFVRRKLTVPMWQIVIPIAGLVVLGYTLYRNVIPYPTSGPGEWEPVVCGVWIIAAVIAVIAAPRTARKLGAALGAREGIAPPSGDEVAVPSPRLATAHDDVP
jgi:amino acid transporter